VTYFLKFWDPLHISGVGAPRDFKFGVLIDIQAFEPKNAKVGQKGRGLRHVTYFYNFGTPLYISGTDKLRTFKFGVRIDRQAYKPKNAKVGQKGRDLRHVTYFFIFGIPSIFLEWVQLETSNLECGFTASLQTKKCKSRSKGARATSRDLIFKFWDTLHISGMDIATDFKFGVHIDRQAYKPKMQK